MSGDEYPLQWDDLSPEDDITVKNCYGELGHCRDLVRSKPELIRVGPTIKHHYMRLFTMQIRPDDVWIVTHPKCGTTWTQEMTWHIMTGVDLDTAKKPLFERSPFIDMVMIKGETKENTDKYFDDLEKAPSPRLIKTHYPFEMLPPALLDTCKVLFVSRNVKDSAVSYFHHENLMKSHDLRCNFLTYARDIYMPGLCLHGGYFEMLESGWKRKDHKNMKLFWYEELKRDQKKIIKEICKFIGYELSEEQINKLDDFLQFDNYQKASSQNKKVPNWKEGKGQFIRKGIVGDWMNHFNKDLNDIYNEWISKSLEKIGIQDSDVVGYFTLDVEF